jgi:tRNA dimethylallyltransferase
MAGVKHHFVDFLELETAYSAGIFEKDVLSIINNSSNKVWLLVGGSGLYVKSIIEGLDDLPSDLILRKSLNERLKKEGLEPLKKELQELDLVHFEAMDTSNPQRIIRALEICLITGQPYSDLRKGRAVERPFRSIQIVLRRERKILRERIEQRCNQMLEEGWLEECRAVFGKRELNSLNTLGYKELFQVIDGSLEMSEARDKIITETSRFAKRQMTWFRAQQDIHYIDMPDDQALDKIIHLLNSSVNQ